jgi:superfamily II DNA or RNA helicase/diadenosine tetraphosphate (Ap4A) HIT family hydrolase
MTHCPFCTAELSRIAYMDDHVVVLWDAFPVSPGHLLIVPRRHAATWDDLSADEKQAIWQNIDRAKYEIERKHRPDGYNVGFNLAEAAGQTVFHFHLHMIPRYRGDVDDPRGGVRHVVPHKANYLAQEVGSAEEVKRLVTGGSDHLLPHLILHMDQTNSCDIAVAFLLDSGARLVVEHLKDFLARGGRARILVGDYMDVTEPMALRRLADLDGDLTLRVFEAIAQGFHLKTYIFMSDKEGVAFVGSSNLSEAALTTSIEWNYKVISSHDRSAFPQITDGFEELFNSYSAVAVTPEWIDRYENRRNPQGFKNAGIAYEPPLPVPEPHAIQRQALSALERTRQDGYTAGLVVLATGLGKTWLAAFDSDRLEYRRILFVAHREEILNQAIETFRRVRPTARIGRLSGDHKDTDADLLFASVQTLGKANQIRQFRPDAFDYIVIDEFHHAAASTYRRIIDCFEPKFLLGLTATPERSDGADLLGLCQENLVFQAGIHLGIEGGHLCPFHYFGVPDNVDYRNIPWRSAQFDLTELTAAVATEARAQNALEQYRLRGGKKCIGFCCSQTHADFMTDFFNRHGVSAVAVHAGSNSAPRATSLQRLEAGELEVVFAVDMFNEGVDVPSIDTVLMLRPTESTIIWLQQLGRGLRKSANKDRLVVIDYIGNHRIFLTKLRAIASIANVEASSSGHIRELLERLQGDQIRLPTGCEVTYDLKAIDILRMLVKPASTENALEDFYRDFLERHGVRPTASEVFHAGINPRSNSERSWLGFVERMRGLDDLERATWSEHRDFFQEVEKTELTRSYKLMTLLSLFDEETVRDRCPVDEIVERVARLASRVHKLQTDFSVDLSDRTALKALLLKFPIDVLTKLRDSNGAPYFVLEGGRFGLARSPRDSETFSQFLREILDWRLAQYLSRSGGPNELADAVCRVARNASGQPILFLPTTSGAAQIPEGPLDVVVDDQPMEATVAKIAINVVRRAGDPSNQLPAILRGWFGDDAGLPGKGDRIRLRLQNDVWRMEPIGAQSQAQAGLRLWERYSREAIPPAFGLTFDQATWNAGFVPKPPHIFLLVTLEKGGMMDEHRYTDHFISATEFSWQSQNRTRQQSKHGEMIRDHQALGLHVHLLVRKTKKIGPKPAPFIYCGEVDFETWTGEMPIAVTWRLRETVPSTLLSRLKN